MTMLLLGFIAGVCVASIGFVVWNLQSNAIDDLEEGLRAHRAEWEKGKAELRERLRKLGDKP